MMDENKNQDTEKQNNQEKQENQTHDNVIKLYADNEITDEVVKKEMDNKECAMNIKHEAGDEKINNIVNTDMEGSVDTAPNGGPVDPVVREASMHTIPSASEFADSITPDKYNRANSTRYDDRGEFRSASDGTAAIGTSSRTMRFLGWISTIFTAFVSPYFALAGILFGILANRQVRGSGNAVIFTNIILAAINILFGFFLIGLMRNMMFGY